MAEQFRGQELLVARDRFGCTHLLGAIGETAYDMADTAGDEGLWGLSGWNENDMPPAENRHYVWEGSIHRSTDRIWSIIWDGTWRHARVDDLARFGLAPLEEATK